MIAKQYIVDTLKFSRRKKTTIQHKLRVVLKCYTVTEFEMNEDNTFSFKKNYRVRGLRIEDKNTLTGNVSVEELSENKSRITITVNT